METRNKEIEVQNYEKRPKRKILRPQIIKKRPKRKI